MPIPVIFTNERDADSCFAAADAVLMVFYIRHFHPARSWVYLPVISTT
jgi:hypothetical protein